jgi:Domain of unknown function (DUF5655)
VGVNRQLWTCPRCGRTFANTHQTHTCALLSDLDRHFEGADAVVRAMFDSLVGDLGPLTVLPEKSRIALHVRMSFAAFMPRKHWLDGHLVLAREAQHPLFRKTQVFSPHNVLHEFRLTAPTEIDAPFLALLHEAYAVGERRHHPHP